MIEGLEKLKYEERLKKLGLDFHPGDEQAQESSPQYFRIKGSPQRIEVLSQGATWRTQGPRGTSFTEEGFV